MRPAKNYLSNGLVNLVRSVLCGNDEQMPRRRACEVKARESSRQV